MIDVIDSHFQIGNDDWSSRNRPALESDGPAAFPFAADLRDLAGSA